MHAVSLYAVVLLTEYCTGVSSVELLCSSYQELFDSYDLCFNTTGYDVIFSRADSQETHVEDITAEMFLQILVEVIEDSICRKDSMMLDMLECFRRLLHVCLKQKGQLDILHSIPTFDIIEDVFLHLCDHQKDFKDCSFFHIEDLLPCFVRQKNSREFDFGRHNDIHSLFCGFYMTMFSCIGEKLTPCGQKVVDVSSEVYAMVVSPTCLQ